MPATEKKVVYLPKMETRPGFKHSYQSKPGLEVVTVDPAKGRRDAKAASRLSGKRASTDDE